MGQGHPAISGWPSWDANTAGSLRMEAAHVLIHPSPTHERIARTITGHGHRQRLSHRERAGPLLLFGGDERAAAASRIRGRAGPIERVPLNAIGR